MSVLPLPDFEIHSAAELASYLEEAVSWREVEALTAAFPQWKEQAWELLSETVRERIKLLKQWKDHAVAHKFPPGSIVQRQDDTEGLTGKVIDYWSAYGVDYITFRVGEDVDWCRVALLKRVSFQ